MLAIVAGSGTFFVDKPARRFLEIPGQSVVLRSVLVRPPLWMLMVAVGSPDGILARNSTGSVALALIAGVANGPLEARGCEGKRC